MNRIDTPQFPQRELFESTLKAWDYIKYRGEVCQIEKVTKKWVETILSIKVSAEIPTYAVESKVFIVNIPNNDM